MLLIIMGLGKDKKIFSVIQTAVILRIFITAITPAHQHKEKTGITSITKNIYENNKIRIKLGIVQLKCDGTR